MDFEQRPLATCTCENTSDPEYDWRHTYTVITFQTGHVLVTDMNTNEVLDEYQITATGERIS